jgi:hypothetical protein
MKHISRHSPPRQGGDAEQRANFDIAAETGFPRYLAGVNCIQTPRGLTFK